MEQPFKVGGEALPSGMSQEMWMQAVGRIRVWEDTEHGAHELAVALYRLFHPQRIEAVKDGQGSRLVPASIEITPEMVAAGVYAAREHALGAPLEDLVDAIYTACEVERQIAIPRLEWPKGPMPKLKLP